MIAIGQFVFLYSFFYYDKHSFLLHKMDKKEVFSFTVLFTCCIFYLSNFSFRHWETTSVLITHIIELTLSVIFLIIWIYFLYKNQN